MSHLQHVVLSDTQEKVHELALVLSGLFALLAILVSMHLIYQHNRNLSQPLIQNKIIGILWMVPIYSIQSWFSLRFIESSLYLDMIRDCYEAYVIYLFLALMIAYLGNGDEYKVVDIIESLPPMPHPFPFGYIWDPVPMDKTFLRRCKFGALQFVILKPLTTLVAILLESEDLYCGGSFSVNCGYPYIVFVQNLSITIAFYDLVLFYIALHDHLAPFNPVPKFICVKAVLFLSFWQGVLIAGLAEFNLIHEIGTWTVDDVSTGMQNLLICFEMFIAAIAHCYAFSASEFLGAPSMRSGLLQDNFALGDAVRDINEVMPGRVLLPSRFTPGEATITTHDDSNGDSPVRNSSPVVRLHGEIEHNSSHYDLTDDQETTRNPFVVDSESDNSDEEEESGNFNGWKL